MCRWTSLSTPTDSSFHQMDNNPIYLFKIKSNRGKRRWRNSKQRQTLNLRNLRSKGKLILIQSSGFTLNARCLLTTRSVNGINQLLLSIFAITQTNSTANFVSLRGIKIIKIYRCAKSSLSCKRKWTLWSINTWRKEPTSWTDFKSTKTNWKITPRFTMRLLTASGGRSFRKNMRSVKR